MPLLRKKTDTSIYERSAEGNGPCSKKVGSRRALKELLEVEKMQIIRAFLSQVHFKQN